MVVGKPRGDKLPTPKVAHGRHSMVHGKEEESSILPGASLVIEEPEAATHCRQKR